jgi:RimJ/RimL family protein N-acetyltransferase
MELHTALIRAIGRPQRDLLVEMYDRFDPLGAAFGLPPRDEERRGEWIDLALSHKMNLAAFTADRTAIGHCFLAADTAGSAELAVFVRQEFRRRGVATRLLKAALDWAAAEGLLRVWTLTGSENIAALRLQERLGFRPRNFAFYGIEMEIGLPAACRSIACVIEPRRESINCPSESYREHR